MKHLCLLLAGLLFPALMPVASPGAAPSEGATVSLNGLATLPLTRTPRLTFRDEPTDKRAERILSWLREKYGDRLDENALLTPLFVRHLAETVVPDRKGNHLIHTRAWGESFTAYNRCVRVCSRLNDSKAPASFRLYLARQAARIVLTENSELDDEGFVGAALRIPADSTLLPRVEAGALIGHINLVCPTYGDLSPLSRKLVLDELAALNPNLRPAGFYTVDGRAAEPLDHVTVPLQGKRSQVFVYRILDASAPLIIPTARHLLRSAAGRRLDLRDFRDIDFALIDGMDPEALDLSHTRVKDLSALRHLKSLRVLDLSGTPVEGLASLSGLQLLSLDISKTPVTDLAPLRGMPLRELRLTGTRVSDLSPLKGMPLARLEFRETAVTNLAPLAGMPLEEVLLSRQLYAGTNVLSDMKSLRGIADYPPDKWLEATGQKGWEEPVPVVLDSMRGGAHAEIAFRSNEGGYPCDETTFHLVFGEAGGLLRAFAARPRDGNIIHTFEPTRFRMEGEELVCHSVVAFWFGGEGINVYTGKGIDYEYQLRATIGERAMEGAFHLRYERHVFDPHGGFKIVVTDVDGAVTGRISRGTASAYPRPGAPPDRDWPTWRGPAGTGLAAPDGRRLVESLGEARLAWVSEERVPGSEAADGRSATPRNKCLVSGGYGGPIVHEGRVFLYYYEPAKGAFDERITPHHIRMHGYGREKWYVDANDVLLCSDAITGRTVWKRVFSRKGLNLNGYNAGRAQPMLTPCAADGTVYAIGTGGHVYAVHARTGETLWERNLGRRWEIMERTRSHARRRRRLPRFDRDFGTSPVVAGNVLVCSDHYEYAGGQRKRLSGLLGLDSKTGRQLWHSPEICGMTASPVLWKQGDKQYILASSEDTVRCLDPVTGTAVWQLRGASFPTAPGLSDRMLVCNGPGNEGLSGYGITPEGAKKLWATRGEKALTASAPVITAGHLWMDYGTNLACIAADTGAIVLEATREAGTHGSVVGLGNRALVEGFHLCGFSNGVATVAPPWRLPIAKGTTPACADGRLFIRGRTHVLCYDLRQAPSERPARVPAAELDAP